MKFKEVYIQYLKYIETRLKKQSVNSLTQRFDKIILPFWENYNIYQINENDYINFQNYIIKKDYSNNYNKNIHYLMSGFFKYCIKFYNINKNIASNVGNFKMKNEEKNYKFYNYKQFKKFIKKVDNNIYKQFFIFMFFTGTRPGEAMAIKFSDLNNSIISINKTIDEHGKREIDTPKTFTSIRKIRIDRKLNKELLKLKIYYKKKYKNINYDFYIFGGIKPLSPTTINRHKIKACNKANIYPIKLHEFRHSHATLLVNKKIMINEISRRLGHSNVSITLNTYVHTDEKQEKKVIKTLNKIRLN